MNHLQNERLTSTHFNFTHIETESKQSFKERAFSIRLTAKGYNFRESATSLRRPLPWLGGDCRLRNRKGKGLGKGKEKGKGEKNGSFSGKCLTEFKTVRHFPKTRTPFPVFCKIFYNRKSFSANQTLKNL
ncbi:hypothetical protein V6Z11_D01G144100 [Gossypium hirsutum]